MWIEEIDVRREPGYGVMCQLRRDFAVDMLQRYPESDADYGPDTLPSGMHRPEGRFLVLMDNANPVGCVGLRKLPAPFAANMGLTDEAASKSGEGKSLFIEPSARNGLGAALLMRFLVETAIECGYESLYGNTGLNQPESVRVLKGFGEFKSEEIPLYDPSNKLAAFAFKLDLVGVKEAL